MHTLNRRQLLLGGACTLLGLGAGCGSGLSLPASLTGFLLFHHSAPEGGRHLGIARPDGSESRMLLERRSLVSVSPDREVLFLYEPALLYGNTLIELASPMSATSLPQAWSPDSQHLLLGDFGAQGFIRAQTVARTGELQPVAAFTPSHHVHSVGWLDTHTLTYQGLDGTFRFELESGVEEKLSEKRFHTPSPDGHALLRHSFNAKGGFLERLDTRTRATEVLVEELAFLAEGYQWSANGQYVLLSGNRSRPLAIRIHADNKTVEEFPLVPIYQIAPQVIWSPDSQSFAYTWYKETAPWVTTTQGSLEVRGTVGATTIPASGALVAWL